MPINLTKAFLVSPLLAAMPVSLLTVLFYLGWNHEDTEYPFTLSDLLSLCISILAISYSSSVLIGLPLYLVFRNLINKSFIDCIILCSLSGFIGAACFLPLLPLFSGEDMPIMWPSSVGEIINSGSAGAALGCISGIVFWCYIREHNKSLKVAP